MLLNKLLPPVDLQLRYKCTTVDEIQGEYDVVVASEVVEHVPCVETFVRQCCHKVKVSSVN